MGERTIIWATFLLVARSVARLALRLALWLTLLLGRGGGSSLLLLLRCLQINRSAFKIHARCCMVA